VTKVIVTAIASPSAYNDANLGYNLDMMLAKKAKRIAKDLLPVP
jgi:hypothetical protein